jgi:hypothetical protein
MEQPQQHEALELLPPEVWWHVLQHLGFGSLAEAMRVALVCRAFHALVTGSDSARAASLESPPFAPLCAAAAARQWAHLQSHQRWRRNHLGPSTGPSPLIHIASGSVGTFPPPIYFN